MTTQRLGSVVAGDQRAAPVGVAGLSADGLVPADPHAAYRRGLCRDCFVTRYSPGRTRCADCYHIYAASGPAAAAASGAARRAAWIAEHVGVGA